MKKYLAILAFLTVVVGSLFGAYSMHQNLNAKAVDPTWQKPVVTVDWILLEDLAKEWDTPFQVKYQPKGADITTDVKAFGDMTGGEAKKNVDGDRIVGCAIHLDGNSGVDFVAIKHELGHCFGLHHDNGHESSIMYWIQGGNSGSTEVTDLDNAALNELYSN